MTDVFSGMIDAAKYLKMPKEWVLHWIQYRHVNL